MFRGFLKQSTQVTKTIYMESNAAPRIGVTGLAAGITKYLSKAGGAAAAITPTTAEVDSVNMTGVYSVVFTTAHTDTLGEFSMKGVGAGANHINDTWEVVTYLPGEQVLVQSGTGTGQVSLTAGLVTLAGVTHTGAVVPTVTTVTDLTTTANAESTAVPASNASLSAKIAWIFTLARNKLTQSSTTTTLYADNESSIVSTSTVSDSGTTFTRGEYV